MFVESSLKKVLISIIRSIDLYNYMLKKHHERVALISHEIGKAYGLKDKELVDLVLAASLHDIGALSTEDRKKLVEMDVLDPEPHEQMGYRMLKGFKHFDVVSQIVLYHHIDYQKVLEKNMSINSFPVQSFILHLADRIDILMDPNKLPLEQIDYVVEQINLLDGKLFEPSVVKVFNDLAKKEHFWNVIQSVSLKELLDDVISDDYLEMTNDNLEDLAKLFAHMVDFKSSYTATHSVAVASVSYELAKLCGYNEEDAFEIKIAGYLHDIGKIAIPSEIIEKSGSLTSNEYKTMKFHPSYTYLILANLKGFENVARWAASHHETHDEQGYPFRYKDEEMEKEMEVIAFADIFTAVREDRPYRGQMSKQETIDILRDKVPLKLSGEIEKVVEENFDFLDSCRVRAEERVNF